MEQPSGFWNDTRFVLPFPSPLLCMSVQLCDGRGVALSSPSGWSSSSIEKGRRSLTPEFVCSAGSLNYVYSVRGLLWGSESFRVHLFPLSAWHSTDWDAIRSRARGRSELRNGSFPLPQLVETNHPSGDFYQKIVHSTPKSWRKRERERERGGWERVCPKRPLQLVNRNCD